MLLTTITFIIVFGVLVFVHEFGHFWVAKKSGMKVDEFGFGFPPRLAGIQRTNGRWSFVWGHKPPQDPEQTVYSINWIPLGGFVKIVGENNDHEEDPRSFVNRPFWGRFFTLVAGVFMNVVLAWVLISIGFMINLPAEISGPSTPPAHAIISKPQVMIRDLVAGSPAQKAGAQAGDIILSVDGNRFIDYDQVRSYIQGKPEQNIQFILQRTDKSVSLTVHADRSQESGKGMVGIEMANIANVRYPWYLAFTEGAKGVFYQAYNIVSGLGQLVSGHVGLKSLGGPVKIAQLTGQAQRLGFIYLMQFAAFLSLNLAILNILPFPALDGGRVLFLFIGWFVEKITGKKNINLRNIEQWVNTVGFVLLVLLMLAVTVKDVIQR